MVDYMNLTEGEAQVRRDAERDTQARYENDMGEMEADRIELEAQLAAAHAIIEKLDRNADGDAVMPGDTAFYLRLINPETMQDEITVQSDVVKSRDATTLQFKDGGYLPIASAHSTKATAEAAAKGDKK